MDWDEAEISFEKAYHSTDPAREIRSFLRTSFPSIISNHLSAMFHFCNVLSEADPDRVMGMFYGMLWRAWELFRKEQEMLNEETSL
jgi:hypothetical protein